MDSAARTLSTFAPLVGNAFRAHAGSEAAELQLIEAAALPVHVPEVEPFSLVFRGPLDLVLPQGLYAMEHETLGRLELFLVPIGPDEEGMRFEAVFN